MTDTSSQTEQSSQTSEVGQTSSGLPTVGEVRNDPVTETFEGLGNDFNDVDTLAVEAKPTPAIVVPPVVAAKPAVVPPVVAPAAEAAPAIAPVQPPAEVTAAAPSTEAQPANADTIVQALENDPEGKIFSSILPAFALSNEQIAALESDAPAEVPKLLAQTYMRAVSTGIQYMKQLVPQMIMQHMNEQNLHQEAEGEFFGKFKDLNRTAHGSDIATIAKAFSSANPNLTRSQLFDLVGASVRAKHGLTGAPRSAAPTRQAVFQPAGGHAPIVSTNVVPEASIFDGLGQDFD